MIYTTYGDEWKKEVSKLPKSALIEMAANLGKAKEAAEESLRELGVGKNETKHIPSDQDAINAFKEQILNNQ